MVPEIIVVEYLICVCAEIIITSLPTYTRYIDVSMLVCLFGRMYNVWASDLFLSWKYSCFKGILAQRPVV